MEDRGITRSKIADWLLVAGVLLSGVGLFGLYLLIR